MPTTSNALENAMSGTATPVPPSPTQNSGELIGFWRRFLAYMVDAIIISIVTTPVAFSIGFFQGITNSDNSIASSIPSLLIAGAYYIGLWILMNGETPGKKLLAIKIVRTNGQKMDFVTALLRFVGYFTSWITLGLGFLWLAWDERKQDWADKIASTNVVSTGKKPHTGIAIAIVSISILFWLLFFGVIIALIVGVGMMSQNEELQNSMMESMREGLEEEYTEEEIDEMMMEMEKMFEDGSEDSKMMEEESTEVMDERAQEMIQELQEYGFESQ